MKRHVLVGVAGAVALLLVYTGILALTQGLDHALDQTARLWYWVALLAAGFGVQAGLFSFIHQALRERRAAATASVAASGGVSAGSMAACCAHHLSDIMPLIGLSAAAGFLVRYQVVFILLGVLSNGVGVTVMLETIQRHGLSARVAGWKLRMKLVRNAAVLASVIVLAAAYFLV